MLRSSRLGWIGFAIGVLVTVGDAVLLTALGTEIQVNGRDAMWLVASFFGSSTAVLGFMVGWAIEARRRDRTAARVIAEQADALRATRARLAQQEKLAALGQLASAIAHEVRNPLAVMRSAAQGILEGSDERAAEVREASTFMIDEIDRLHRVVSSLLAFAKPVSLAPRRIRIEEILDRTVDLAREEHAGRSVTIRRGAAAPLPAVDGDPDLLCQVLLGLVGNAVDALPDGGEIVVEGVTEPGGVALVVSDSGPGVPAELRERIFEPFFTTRPTGTGLGLAVARDIVRAHAGRIEVDDRPGGGARFVVHMPAHGAWPEAA